MSSILRQFIVFKDDDDAEIERYETTGVRRTFKWFIESDSSGTPFLHFFTRFIGDGWEIPEGFEHTKKLGGLRWSLHFKREAL